MSSSCLFPSAPPFFLSSLRWFWPRLHEVFKACGRGHSLPLPGDNYRMSTARNSEKNRIPGMKYAHLYTKEANPSLGEGYPTQILKYVGSKILRKRNLSSGLHHCNGQMVQSVVGPDNTGRGSTQTFDPASLSLAKLCGQTIPILFRTSRRRACLQMSAID